MKPTFRLLFVLGAIVVTTAYVPAGAAPPKNSGYPVVPLSVTVESMMTDDITSPAITADVHGDYVDGQDGVSATFDKWGSLIINLQSTPQALRSMGYSYAPLEGQTYSTADWVGTYLSTVGKVFQNIGSTPGSSPTCVKASLTRSSATSSNLYWHYFQRNLGNISVNSDTSWLVATWKDDAPTPTWEIETDYVGTICGGAIGGVTRVFEVTTKGKSSYKDLGTFALPFRMTLKAL